MNWWQNSNRQMQNQRKQIRYIYTIQGVAYGRCSPSTKKNIRRRVYDALNVLMAMGIISKEKKDIRWIGIPTSNKNTPQSLVVRELVPRSFVLIYCMLQAEKELRAQRIARKREHLEELASQVQTEPSAPLSIVYSLTHHG